MSAGYDDLREAVMENFESNGTRADMQAWVRAQIYNAIKDQGPRPKPSPETLIVNELIVEYMKFNGYVHSLSVFKDEARINQHRKREEIAEDLKVNLAFYSPSIPLLYGLTHQNNVEVTKDRKTKIPRPPPTELFERPPSFSSNLRIPAQDYTEISESEEALDMEEAVEFFNKKDTQRAK